ncbi:mitochondrial folate transporter/carrier [Cryomyces antarcticus]
MSIQRTQSPASDRQQYAAPAARSNTYNGPSQQPQPLSALANFARKMPNSSINSFCGAMGGVTSGIVTCPLDVIKTKLQAQGGFRPQQTAKGSGSSSAVYRGMIGTAQTIWRQDGIRGMYRGLGPMLLGYLPTWAVYMSVYDSSREYYYTQVENKWSARVFASITAGACSTLVTNPIWVIKTRLMSQVSARATDAARPPWHYNSTLDAARKMYTTEGLRAFYSGLSPALLGLTHVAIQFPLYEFFKQKFTGLEMGENNTDDNDSHWLGILAATFLSKVCATTATYPHEVLRTRLQTQQRSLPGHSEDGVSHRGSSGTHRSAPGTSNSDGLKNTPRYRGVIRTCQIIWQEEGWRAFYNGMGTNMIRAVPAAMTTMLTFEFMKSTIHRLRADDNASELKEEAQRAAS